MKNRRNIEKHGILFREATEIFGRPIVRRIDKRFNYNETRYILIGLTADGIILTVVCTIRENRIRIISARIFEKKKEQNIMTITKFKINSIDDLPRMTEERAKELKAIPEKDINYSDIPPLDDNEEFEFFKDGVDLINRSKKQKKLISIRIEPDTLKALQRTAKDRNVKYQALISQILETFVHHLDK